MRIPSSSRGLRGALQSGIAWLALAVGGAVVGSICGAVAASELFVPSSTGLGADIGAGGGAAFALATTPLLRHGARRGHRAAGRPAPTTAWAAVSVLAVVASAVVIWIRVGNRLPEDAELDYLALEVIGVVLLAASVVAVAVAIGLVTRHALARWAAVLIFSAVAVDALTALVAARSHHAEPASLLVTSTVVLALVLSPPTRDDFHATTPSS
jgi:hypothetical protein